MSQQDHAHPRIFTVTNEADPIPEGKCKYKRIGEVYIRQSCNPPNCNAAQEIPCSKGDPEFALFDCVIPDTTSQRVVAAAVTENSPIPEGKCKYKRIGETYFRQLCNPPNCNAEQEIPCAKTDPVFALFDCVVSDPPPPGGGGS